MENIEEYGIEIQLQNQSKLYKSLTRLEKRMMSLNKKVYDCASKSQKSIIQGLERTSRATTSKRIGIEKSAQKTILADRLRQEQKTSDKIEKEGFSIVQRGIDKREAAELRHLEKLSRVRKGKEKELAEYRARMARKVREKEQARFKQHISGMTSSPDSTGKITPKNSMFNYSEKEIEFQKERVRQEKILERSKARTAKQQELLQKKIQEEIAGLRVRSPLANKYYDQIKAEYTLQLKQVKSQEELNRLKKEQNIKLSEINRKQRASEKSLSKQAYLQQRMSTSAKQWAGYYVSAFAAVGAITGATRVGQEFEGMESALLTVSDSAELAQQNLQFVYDEAMRLGKPLKESTRAFSRMLASRGNLDTSEIKNIFTSTQEMATVLGLNADETNRAMVAIGQMLSRLLERVNLLNAGKPC